MEERDKRIIGLTNGGLAYSVNGDDGNLNYDKGLISNALKLSSEIEVSYKNFGAFVRGFGFYDYENEKGDRARTPLSGGCPTGSGAARSCGMPSSGTSSTSAGCRRRSASATRS